MKSVYLVEAQCGLLKIGCGYSPEQRLAAIRTHSPVLVRILAQWPGTLLDERDLHNRFEEFRSHNEWFRIDGDLLYFVAEVRGRGLDRVQPWHEITFLGSEGRRAQACAARGEKARQRWADPEYRRQVTMMRERRAEIARSLEAKADA